MADERRYAAQAWASTWRVPDGAGLHTPPAVSRMLNAAAGSACCGGTPAAKPRIALRVEPSS